MLKRGCIALLLALCSCGAGSNLTINGQTALQTTADLIRSTDEVQPLFTSSSGLKLYALDSGGFLTEPDNCALRVHEQVSESSIQWEVVDTDGHPRPIYFRVGIGLAPWQPDELYRGDWAHGYKALVVPAFTREGDLDVGFSLLRDQQVTRSECRNKIVARMIWVPKGSKQPRSNPVTEQTGSGDHGGTLLDNKHNWFPYVVPFNGGHSFGGYSPHWSGMSNRVEAYAVDGSGDVADAIDRDKLSAIDSSDYGPYVVDNNATSEMITVAFAYQISGDYDLNGEANMADITAIAQQYDEASDWDAQGQAATDDNPFAAAVSDPSDTLPNLTDGSMNGVVRVENFADPELQELYNLFDLTPADGERQYDNDLAPLWTHYQEAVQEFIVTLTHSDGRTIVADPDPTAGKYPTLIYGRNLGPISRKKFWLTLPYHKPQYAPFTGLGVHTGTWSVKIQVVSPSGLGKPETETLLSNAFTVPSGYETNTSDSTPPTWPTTAGAISAQPWAEKFRTTKVTWAAAEDTQTNISAYDVYAKTYTSSVPTPSDIKTYSDAEFHTNGATFETKLSLEHLTARGKMEGNWDAGDKVAVIVTATNGASPPLTTTLSGLNVATGYVSYDYSAPYFVDELDGLDNRLDVLRYSWGINPGGQRGFCVYWGYGKDPQTGISDYEVFWDTNEFEGDDLPANSFAASSFDPDNDPVDAYQLFNRFFFIEANDPTADLFVLVKTYNGEGDASENVGVHNLAYSPELFNLNDLSLFQRTTLETDLDVSFDTGEMASKAWHHSGAAQNTAQDLFLVYTREGGMTPGSTTWLPAISGFEYLPGLDPLNPTSWDTWTCPSLPEGTRDYSGGTQADNTERMAPHCELSVEYDGGGSLLRILIPSLGELYDWDAGAPVDNRRQAYVSRVDHPVGGGTDSTFAPYGFNQEMGDTSIYWALPTDISAFALGFSYPWASRSLTEGESVHAPSFTRNNFTGNFLNDYPLFLLGEQIKSGALNTNEYPDDQSILESVTWDGNYFTSGGSAISIWGHEPYSSAGTDDPVLSCYWHQYSDLEDDPTYNNQIKPTEEGPPWSWEDDRDIPVVTTVNDTDEWGLPATITLQGDVAYILYNSASAYGDAGLALARTTGTDGVLEYHRSLSAFPQLVWTTDDSNDDIRMLRHSLDAVFIDSVFNRRRQTLAGFSSIVNNQSSWSGIEQPVEAEEAPDWISDEYVLAVSFIQSSGFVQGLPGEEIFYGEVFNMEGGGSAPSSALMFITLVDSVNLTHRDALESNAEASEPDQFKPIWLSLGATYGVLGDPFQVPVIGYGVDLGDNSGGSDYGNGEVKVASIPHFMIKRSEWWNDLGTIEVYPSDPNEGADYDSGPGTVNGVGTGGTVSGGIIPQQYP